MAYKRRRNKGTWFPVFGNNTGDLDTPDRIQGVYGSQQVFGSGAMGLQMRPLTFDLPHGEDLDDTDDTTTLADIVGSEYLLQRIVGKCYLYIKGIDDEPPPLEKARVLIACGFFVARADGENPKEVPIGGLSATIQEVNKSYNPLAQQTMREPWLWRRTWILSGLGWDMSGGDAFPVANINYGSSSLDGPHVDCKSKRRVGIDDRLWFAMGVVLLPGGDYGSEDPNTMEVIYHLDYRIYGSLRKHRKTGTF